MELSGQDIDLLREFFGTERLKKVTVNASFARGMLSFSREVDMVMEFNHPSAFGPVLASIKFALRGVLKMVISIETINGVARSLSIFINSERVLIFQE